jgi:hypothetical protein
MICRSVKYKRTKQWLIAHIHWQQRRRSKRKWRAMPDYNLKWLREWFSKQDNFDTLYNEWIKSWYDISLTPSCDRLKNELWYSLNNIELVTWKVNNDRWKSVLRTQEKIVYQYDLQWKLIDTHESHANASRITWVHKVWISNCIRWIAKTAWWFIWKTNPL